MLAAIALNWRQVLSGKCQKCVKMLAWLIGDAFRHHLPKVWGGDRTWLGARLGVLVGLKMLANKNRTRLTFLAPPPRIEDILRVSKLDTIFEIRGGVALA